MSKKFKATDEMLARRDIFLAAIEDELARAYAKHGAPQWSRHEFYGVMKEEVDEVWDDIKSNAPQKQLMAEVAQVAAMCIRYAETLDRFREPQDV